MPSVPVPVLTARALNRTLLARQSLLRRAPWSAHEAVRHLVGVQAQESDPPYVGLWTRLADFRHDDLTALLHGRTLVRAKLLRNTQHLVCARDFRWLQPLLSPVLGRARTGAFGRAVAGLDGAELAAAGRELMAVRADAEVPELTRARLGRLLAERFPGRDATALAYVVQSLVPHVHPPPSGTWGHRGATPVTLAESWLGRPVEPAERVRPHTAVTRYLAAFGPASVRDMQAWSGLTRMRAVVEELRPRLRAYRDERGTELFDVPDGTLADPEQPAPARFLPAYDNAVLAHADRTRVISDEDRARVITGSVVRPVFLVDGRVGGTWQLAGGTLRITPYRPLGDDDSRELEAEAGRLLDFVTAAPAVRSAAGQATVSHIARIDWSTV